MKKLLFVAVVLLLPTTTINAQEVKKDEEGKIYVKLKDGAKPDIYVDGKKFDFPMELIDQNKIKAVFVIKGEKAKKEYNAINGVILITTKTSKESDVSEIRITGYAKDKKTPMVIINGKVSNKKILDELKPDEIEKMEVIKGKKAKEKYNAPNGVIIITTKKK
jgi:hypothetical protein